MYRKIAIAGATAAVIVGGGTAALAASGSSSPTPTPPKPKSSTSAHPGNHSGKHGKHHGKHGKLDDLRKIVHGQFVTKGKDGAFVTHDVVRGQVSAVSATSITVAAPDKTETYVLSKDTKVHLRPAAKTKGQHVKPTAGTISSVHTGDTVVVLGTGTTTMTATQILDAGKR